jgi:hypothetical protein
MRSIFFESSKRSAGTGTQPAGCGGKTNDEEIVQMKVTKV